MKSTFYKRYLLGLLLVIYAFNWVDRFALGLLLQDIKRDLLLSDTQLGLLTGIAFALFYSLLGVPIARWADRGDRRMIIAASTAIWSVAIAATALVGNFAQMLGARVAVAIGEAGCVPPAQSLIADTFDRAERPRATAIYLLGVPLAAVFGYFVAGHLNAYLGWRLTFVVMGIPGFALALLAWLTIREPRLGLKAVTPSSLEPPTPVGRATFRAVAGILWSNATFRNVVLGWSLISFFGTGIWQWKPAFFIRSYGLGTTEVGAWFAAIYGVCALAGLYSGGEIASRLLPNDERQQFRAIAVSYCVFGLMQAAMFMAPTASLSFLFLAISTVGIYAAQGPLFAGIQSLVPAQIRATAVAVIYLFANLIGLGLGPLAAGYLSDLLAPRFGAQGLRYALLILCSGYAWAAWHLWAASRTVARDVEAAQAADPTQPAPDERRQDGASVSGPGASDD